MNWQSTTNLYFAAPTSPLNEPIIALTGSENSLINSVACLTDLSPDLSPDNRALLSVTLIGIPDLDDTNLQAQARKELSCWFGNEVAEWKHLCTYRIPHALPCHSVKTNQTVKTPDNIHLCGDYLETASIEGAICSGQAVAKKIVAIT